MPNRRVESGECVLSLAATSGFSDWHKVWDHAENAAIREARSNPYVLNPRDKIFVPEPEQKRVDCTAEQRHSFVAKQPTAVLPLVLEDEEGEALANCRFRLVIGSLTVEGTTDAGGEIHEEIPASATSGELTLWWTEEPEGPSVVWDLQIGSLDPVSERKGVQARLTNLGYRLGAVDGEIGPRTEEALRRFQRAKELEPNGEINQETVDALREEYGC